MATFPTYNSQQNINANPAQVIREEASQPFKDQQKMLGTLQEITQKWSDANDVMQYTEAKAKHSTAIAQIQARADADPNYKDSDKYFKELSAVNKDVLKGISNQEVANKAGIEFNHDAQIAKIKIGANFQKKQLEFNKVNTKVSIDNLMQKKLSATTASEAQQYDNEIDELIAFNVNAGTLTYEEADKMKKDTQETTVKYEIYADESTQEKDSALLKELKKPKGKYSFLDPDTRLKMIEESQRRIFQNNQTMKRADETGKDERFQNIFQKANEGTLTLNDLDAESKASEEGAIGALEQEDILAIRKSLQTRIKNDLEVVVENNDKASDYLNYVDTFISSETDRQKGREAIVNAFKDNVLSPKEASFLNSLKRETEGIQQLKSREEFMGNSLVPFKNAINAVNDFFTGKKNFTESEKAMAIKELLSGSADGVDPYELSQKIIKDNVVKKNPSILNLSPEGQLVVDENGYLRMMNNAGDVWDAETKAPKSEKNNAL